MLWVMMAVHHATSFAHFEEAGRLPDRSTVLHEPRCGRVAKRVRRNIAFFNGQLGQAHRRAKCGLDGCYRLALPLYEMLLIARAFQRRM